MWAGMLEALGHTSSREHDTRSVIADALKVAMGKFFVALEGRMHALLRLHVACGYFRQR